MRNCGRIWPPLIIRLGDFRAEKTPEGYGPNVRGQRFDLSILGDDSAKTTGISAKIGQGLLVCRAPVRTVIGHLARRAFSMGSSLRG